MKIFLYLCGSVQKGRDDKRPGVHFWTASDEQKIRAGLHGHTVRLLNPARSKVSRNDFMANYGCDLYLVSMSNIILCDARNGRGIGVGAELMFAAYEKIPVITLAPKNSHYKRDYIPDVFGEDLHNWVHPFLAALSDYIVDDLDMLIEKLSNFARDGHLPVTKPSPREAINYYLREYSVDNVQKG